MGEIHAAAWEAAYSPFFEPEFARRAVNERRTRWQKRIADEAGTILVADLDNRPAALSFFLSSGARPGYAEIYSFYCHPESWGSGLALALMAETLREASDQRFARIHLWTLRDTARSRRFYAKCGFSESGAVRAHDFGDGNPLEQVEYERATVNGD